MKLFTIGFTKTSAKHFFDRLRRSGARRILDVRLNNVSQLAGFAKRDDLAFFAKDLCGMEYRHEPKLAPTKDIFDAYKKQGGDWPTFEKKFINLMRQRQIESFDPALFDGACLLCSEDKPYHCHRRLIAEYLQEHWGNLEVVHL